jgi:triosephosphate isomerase
VLYGGSVDESTAPELLGVPHVAGLFVGRAALDPQRFAAIAATPIPLRRDQPTVTKRSA